MQDEHVEDLPALIAQAHDLKKLFDSSREENGHVDKSVQKKAMRDIQWEFQRQLKRGWPEAELEKLRRATVDVLSDIDDDVIWSQEGLSAIKKMHVLGLKRDLGFRDIREMVGMNADGELTFKDGSLSAFTPLSAPKTMSVTILLVEEAPNGLRFDCRANTVFPMDCISVTFVREDSSYDLELTLGYSAPYSSFFERDYYDSVEFSFVLPPGKGHLEATVCSVPVDVTLIKGNFCPLSFLPQSYAVFSQGVLTGSKKKARLVYQQRSLTWMLRREYKYEQEIKKRKPVIQNLVSLRRRVWFEKRILKRKERIWLVSDRVLHAGDNGEAFFRFLMENPVKGVKSYFILGSDSPDYERMSKIGPIVAFDSREHHELALRAELIISSAADGPVVNIFRSDRKYISDLLHHRFVFLQHGTILHDLSSWLRKSAKNISLFITSSPREHESIAYSPRYGYDPATVVCTGLARHDGLLRRAENEKGNTLLIAPTWRQSLMADYDGKTGVRDVLSGFEESEFYQFYQRLINDERIIEAAKKQDMPISFLMHQAMESAIGYFSSDYCDVKTEYSYQDEFINAAILVTDYSSIAFDFVLLKKPIIYAQFDRESFFEQTPYTEGYFDYDEDGFGPVCGDYEETVAAILQAIENPVVPPEYAGRLEGVLVDSSTSRCESILAEIEKLL